MPACIPRLRPASASVPGAGRDRGRRRAAGWFLAALLPLSTLALAGCQGGRESGILMAAGSYGDLAVLVSDGDLEPAADRFLAEVNREVTFVIQAEDRFNVDIYGPRRWELGRGYKNILFLVVLGGGGPVEKEVRKLVSAETLEQIGQGPGGLVQLDDPYATYQYAIVLASSDRNSLLSILRGNSERVRTLIEEKNRKRIQRRNRQDGLDERLMNSYWNRFGFLLEIPREYRENQVLPGGYPAVELMQNAPSRGITVAWAPHDAPVEALDDREFLFELRSSMGRAVHDEEVAEAPQVWLRERFGERDAVKLEGVWTSNDFAGGGPFWSYFVADPAGGRVFCIDVLVYAPGMDKMTFFRRLEAVAATFSLERPQP
ncbi:MAG: DUF4837 family protein [Candidatus Krumholzibacteriia bacterium]